MKKIVKVFTLFLIVFTLVACGKKEEEIGIYSYKCKLDNSENVNKIIKHLNWTNYEIKDLKTTDYGNMNVVSVKVEGKEKALTEKDLKEFFDNSVKFLVLVEDSNAIEIYNGEDFLFANSKFNISELKLLKNKISYYSESLEHFKELEKELEGIKDLKIEDFKSLAEPQLGIGYDIEMKDKIFPNMSEEEIYETLSKLVDIGRPIVNLGEHFEITPEIIKENNIKGIDTKYLKYLEVYQSNDEEIK